MSIELEHWKSVKWKLRERTNWQLTSRQLSSSFEWVAYKQLTFTQWTRVKSKWLFQFHWQGNGKKFIETFQHFPKAPQFSPSIDKKQWKVTLKDIGGWGCGFTWSCNFNFVLDRCHLLCRMNEMHSFSSDQGDVEDLCELDNLVTWQYLKPHVT